MELQLGLFDTVLHDTRTRTQRTRQRNAGAQQQAEMFSAIDLAVNARRTFAEFPASNPIFMQIEDPRTDEQRAADLQASAQALTEPLL